MSGVAEHPSVLEIAGSGIAYLIGVQAERAPDAVAIAAPGRVPLSYGRLHAHVCETVRRLNAMGIGRNDRVAVVLPNGPEMAAAFLGIAAGATCAPLNPGYRAAEFEFYLADLDAKALVVLAGDSSPAIGVARERGIPIVTLAPMVGEAAGLFTLEGDCTGTPVGANLVFAPGPAGAEDVALILHTSGTTSRPKMVPLTQTNVCVSAGNVRDALALAPGDRCLNVMPLFHIHGLIGALLSSLSAGAAVICSPGFVAPEFFRWMEECRPTWYTAVPTMHQAILARAEANSEIIAGCPLRLIRSSSSALPPQVMAELERVFGAPVIEAYGMTEAAHQMASNPLPPRARKPGSVGVAAGPEIAVMDEAGALLPPGETGEIIIRGANVTPGYAANPEANAKAFTGGFASDTKCWFRTGDQGFLDAEGYLHLTGRIKEIINRGGEKISPREIDEVLLDHPAVAQAVAFAVPHTALGEEVAAAVVLREGHDATERQLQEFAAGRLADFKVPRRILLLDEIPKGPTGKLQRIGLAEKLGLAVIEPVVNAPAESSCSGRSPDRARPRTPLEEMLAAIWAAVLGVDRVGIHDDFLQLGGDSVLATQLVSRVREAAKADLSLLALFSEASTVATMAQLLGDEPTQGAEQPDSVPETAPRERPLSFAQERQWFLNQWDPANPVYNRPFALRLSGPLVVDALRDALSAVVARHETLRATFAVEDGRPVQMIRPPGPIDLPVVDLSHLPPGERDARAGELALEEARRPFDLAHGPLLRASLLRLDADSHVLLLNLHHIISDGWSMGVLYREVAALYQAFQAGSDSPLPALPSTYADYALWQREWLQGEVYEKQLAYWRGDLEGAPMVLDLPSDRPRPSAPSFRGDRQCLTLPRELAASLKSLGRREGATLFMLLHAAWNALLYRYTGQEDILVGTAISGRTRGEDEALIGFFANTLVLRTDLSGDPTFRELLGRARKRALGAYAHQNIPFEKLVEELQAERDLSRNPLFQVMFVLQNTPTVPMEIPGVAASAESIHNGTAKVDLTLEVTDTPEGLQCRLEYSTDLFDGATIARMLGHWKSLLEGIAARPEERISRLPLLTEGERRQVLGEWNATEAEYPRDRCVHHLFEEQARRRPDAVAVEFGEQRLTYGELDRRANQLAHALSRLGVGPETLVAICVERSLEMAVGILGILKAGGAYVPLDPAYPTERLAFMLEDSRPAVLLTQERLRPGLPPCDAEVIALDADRDGIRGESEDRPASDVSPENLAYIIYTSGSTGRPKGVQVPHAGVVNLLCGARAQTGVSEKDTVVAMASLSFDMSVLEIFVPWSAGGRVVIADSDTAIDGHRLADLLARSKATFMHATPATFRMLLDAGWSGDRGMKVAVGGEALPIELAERLLRSCAGLSNVYGPTETTVWCSAYRVQRVEDPVPIGRALPNCQLYVLDRHRQLVPVGVPGELYIGGIGVTRGYLNRPELTEERFVEGIDMRAEGTHVSKRLYRTGDLVRWRADGNIEFLGRIDHQVKIRGFRIELGEIETALRQHPAVRAAVVVAREDNPGDRRLVAYVVLKDQRPETRDQRPETEDGAGQDARQATGTTERVSPTGLSSFLGRTLPEYMVPSALVVLDELPLTPNRKVDRKALPAPEWTGETGETFVPPRTETEEALCRIWGKVLRLERVGAQDHFFRVGGHSLLATQVISRVREELGVELPVRALFEAPTVAGFAGRIDAASGDARRAQAPPIRPVARDGALPLSFAQQRLWLLDRIDPGDPSYNVPLGLRLVGTLDVPILERSLGEIVRRHEALRTTFTDDRGTPVQVIAPPGDLELPVRDLGILPISDRNAELDRLLAEESRRPFDLAAGPLVRALLLRLGEEEHVLLLVVHHAVSDGWSMGVLWRELSALYEAFHEGRPSPLPELPIQYADYAVWQREWLQGDVLEAQLAYWKQQLAEAPAVLDLPADRPRPPVRTSGGARESLVIPQALADRLRALSEQEDVTLFMTLLAGAQALLSRCAGVEDVVVGTPIAGRRRGETEALIGFFVNTLVLRTDLSGDPGFRELLGRVRQTALEAYAHQDLPFEGLVEALQPERDESRTPLFQVMFALQNTPTEAPALAGMGIERMQIDTGTAKFDLGLFITETPQGLHCNLEYSTDLFDRETIARMLGHWQTLLEGIVARPEERISRLPLLTEAERRQVLVEWNATEADFPRNRCIHHLFEEQARRRPDAVAVQFGEQQLTYAELDRRANQLAHVLAGRGVGPETLVGICVERSLEMVVGVLGILKAGGAYVPLDSGYPAERLAFMLEDARPAVLLTQERLRPGLPPCGAEIIALDTGWEAIGSEPDEALTPGVSPENLAYIIYTSGSTGRPKGVQIAHGGVVNLLHGACRYPGVSEEDVLVAAASLSFDLSVFEILLPLSVGARLVVADSDAVMDGRRLADLLARTGVTFFHSTPATLAMLVGAGWSGGGRLRIVSGGEALSRDLGDRLLERVGDLWQAYGPTETTVWCSVHRVQRAEDPIPIGRAIPNYSLYVLDRHRQPVPVGVPGELYIGGVGVARGYLNRPELTAERFVTLEGYLRCGMRNAECGMRGAPPPTQHSTLPTPHFEVYRTGDLVRWRRDGNVEFLGRIDHQVKLRGFRIELGEIEAVLRQHPDVRECVVLAREDAPGDKRLIAYVVPRQGNGGNGEVEEMGSEPPVSPSPRLPVTGSPVAPSSEIREFLAAKLPDYMVPSAFVFLEALPLTPNRKVDRKALPAPEGSGETDEEFVPPRTPTEEALCRIWGKVLRLERVGAQDHFFRAGGHSLLATQVISRVREELGVELPVRALFEAPTVAGFAGRIDAASGDARRAQAPPIRPVARDGALPLSFAQQRLWLLDRIDPGNPSYNLPVRLRLTGALDVPALQHALAEIVRRHEVLRTAFVEERGTPTQVIALPGDFALPVQDLSALPVDARETELHRLLAEEGRCPFDLAKGPLVRALLLRLGEEEHVLLLTFHHAVSDGWSMGVLSKELPALYGAFREGNPSPLPELPLQYADYAVWQREWLQGDVLEAQLAYWRERLGGDLPVMDLPIARPRPLVQEYRGGHEAFDLPTSVIAALNALGEREGATLFMTMLAAFKLLLSRAMGSEDIVVGTPIAGRHQGQTEDLIGFFVNTLALRTDLSGGPTFRELLGRVRQVALGAYANQDVPFEKLVQELQPERSLGHTPLVQILFNFLSFAWEPPRLSGLQVDALPITEVPGSKFDMTLYLRERGGSLSLRVVYNSDLFAAHQVRELLEQYGALLAQVAARPDEPIHRFSLVTDAARPALPDPTIPLPFTWEGSVPARLAQQARRVGERIAIADSQGAWTYAELQARSNQLARLLLSHGLQKGEVVAVYGQRSGSLACALLGILKAGAAFLILDPAYPAAQQASRLRAAAPRAWIAVEGAGDPPEEAPRALAEAECRCALRLPSLADAAWEKMLSAHAADDLDTDAGPDDLAYVVFTSGSTGAPRGILGTHRPLSHFLEWHTQAFGLDEGDRFSMLSGLAHDPLLRDIFAPLWAGATLCVPDPEGMGHPSRLAEWVRHEGITVSHLTPPLAQILSEGVLGGGGAAPVESLRYAFFGGDMLTVGAVSRLREAFPAVTCVNFYGTTETPQAMAAYVIPGETSEQRHAGESIPIGRGIRDVQLLVLNRSQGLAGVGEVGEVHVRTPYLASGYLGEETLTRERFITNPFTGQPGDRVYRTGDLGYYLPDGNVQFLGRRDHQVKVRGFRIELGEIEAALKGHPGVHDAAVLAREEIPGEKRLVAYVVGASDDGGALREFLQGRLPAYMLPAAIVTLEALPLTPNGKLDQRALPAPSLSAAGDESLFEVPRTPAEELVAGIWADVLRVERVGAHDNFFLLGGHSLLAAQVVSRVREALRVDLPLRDLFEAPTVARFAAVVERALGAQRDVTALSVAGSAEEAAPLSLAQERLWVLHQLAPESPAYNMPAAVRLTGNLRPDALRRTLGEVVRRHETLRTRFPVVDGRPSQVVAPAGPVDLPVIDLRHLREAEREDEALRAAALEASHPFDLEQGPLFRPRLLRLDEDEHILLLVMHHTIADGWSVRVLFREVGVLYDAFAAGRPSPLPELPTRYADFARWQRQTLTEERIEDQLAYWRDLYASRPPVLELPTDRPRPPIQTLRGARQLVHIPTELTESLKGVGRQEGATLFMTLMAAFQTLLYGYTGQEDVVVGTPLAGRNRVEVEGLVGAFINTLPIRGDLSGAPSFREVLGRTRHAVLGAFAHQDVPPDRLMRALDPGTDRSRAPLFQVMLVLLNTPMPRVEIPGLALTPLSIDNGTAKLDITLQLFETPDGLGGYLEYNTDLFDDATMARLLGHLRTLLEGIAADPGQPVGALPLLAEEERRRLVVDWNATETEYPRDACVHHLVERQVARTPEAVAVAFPGGILTYRELNRRANQLARHLRSRGVAAPSAPPCPPKVGGEGGAMAGLLVGVCMERAPELMVALLGVLKAGGAYVPLDPAYPKERLSFILEDSGAPVLLSQERLLGTLPETAAHVLCLDTGWDAVADEEDTDLPGGASAESPAYVIYTSGSTGQPKGVLTPHRAVVNHNLAVIERYGISAEDRVLQFSSISFDMAVEEIFPAWMTGATLVLRTDEMLASAHDFVQAVERERITVLDLPTAFWHQWVGDQKCGMRNAECGMRNEGSRPLPESLRLVIVGGEKASASAFAAWRRLAGDRVRWLNTYGPTETTIVVTVYEPPADVDLETLADVPIGRPIANTRAYVLDRNLRPVPIGVPGELCIGGDCLAHGYLNRPELTAERFVILEGYLKCGMRNAECGMRGAAPPTQHSTLPTAHFEVYRTGDLVRWLPDGNLQYLGRIDDQVKVRGYRVELGEIEAALSRLPGIRECVVLAREDAPGDKRLVAYVVPEDQRPETRDQRPETRDEEGPDTRHAAGSRQPADFRAYLSRTLPEYMVPSAFVFLEALPLTPAGKVDRRALPAPDMARREPEETFVAPRTPAERALAGIWREVLGVEQIGVHDAFFDLGGHSLLAMQAIARARAAFGVDVSLRGLFDDPTLAGQALAITRQQAELAQDAEMEDLMAELDALSDEEAESALSGEAE